MQIIIEPSCQADGSAPSMLSFSPLFLLASAFIATYSSSFAFNCFVFCILLCIFSNKAKKYNFSILSMTIKLSPKMRMAMVSSETTQQALCPYHEGWRCELVWFTAPNFLRDNGVTHTTQFCNKYFWRVLWLYPSF